MRRQELVLRPALLLALVAALLGLSGCFKASEEVHVKADGSGSVTLHAEVDKKALAAAVRRFGASGGAPSLTPMRAVDRSFPDGTKVRVVDRPERATLDASFDFRGPDEYTRKLQQVGQAVSDSGATATDPGSIKIRRTVDGMEVALDVSSSAGSADGLDLSLLRSVLGPDSLPKLVVTITMPGSILATNGIAQGRTVTWDLSKDAPAMLTVSSTVAQPGPPLWPPLLGGCLILLVLGVTVSFFFSQRKHASSAGAAEPGSEPLPSADRPGTGTFFPLEPEAPPRGWPVPPPSEPPSPPPVQPPWIPAPIGPSSVEPPAPAAGPTRPTPAAAPAPATGDPLPRRVPEPPADRPPSSPRPPAPTIDPQAAPVPGWYADPAGGRGLRYWDGRQWTPHTT